MHIPESELFPLADIGIFSLADATNISEDEHGYIHDTLRCAKDICKALGSDEMYIRRNATTSNSILLREGTFWSTQDTVLEDVGVLFEILGI